MGDLLDGLDARLESRIEDGAVSLGQADDARPYLFSGSSPS
jgi:hypothetical protein